MKIQFKLTIAAIFCCGCFASAITGQTPGDNSKQKNDDIIKIVGIRNESTWRGKIAANGLVEIVGIQGDIQTEATSGNEVEVVAVKEGNNREFDQVQMRVEESAGGVKICAAFPLLREKGKSQCLSDLKFNSMSFDDNRALHLGYKNGETLSFRLADVRLQIRIRVPAGVQVFARTLRGNIVAKGITAKLQAVNTNGNITASLATTEFSGPIDLVSVNGSVILTVPDKINAHVQLGSMNGEIVTEFPVTVPGGYSGDNLEGTVGRGGQKINLGTLNGNVELLRDRDPSNFVSKVIPGTKPNESIWRGKIPADGLLEIVGISGDIYAEVTSGDEVEVVAIREGSKEEIDKVRTLVIETQDGVKFCSAFPLLEQERSECLADEKWSGLASESRDGDQKVYVRYESGKKQNFRVTGIRVQYKVRIPAEMQFNAQVRLEAPSGTIATDFPLIVLGRLPARTLVGTIGQGGLKVTLRTLFGNVELRRPK